MTGQTPLLTRETLLGYFLDGAAARDEWKVGMEVEKLGRRLADGGSIPYDGADASVRRVLETILAERGGDPVYEANNLIGIDAPWGTISLEPGGQVEWSSRPAATLTELDDELRAHLGVMKRAAEELGIRWLDVAVDPVNPVSEMRWMPKARYKIMRSYLGARGRLAHRMMTQSASVQCAFDYADPTDWKRKFAVCSRLAPVATALFANSSRVDGAESGWRSYRQAIWAETDPDRCGLPRAAFDHDFGLEECLKWMLSIPTLFLHRARGLVPAGGLPFREFLDRSGCDAARLEDWETHVSTIFTEVRSYTYLEVRSADLQPDELCLAVPAFWMGLLYDDDALEGALELVRDIDTHDVWSRAMESAARAGLDGEAGGRRLRELARRAVALSVAGLRNGGRYVGDVDRVLEPLAALDAKHDLNLF